MTRSASPTCASVAPMPPTRRKRVRDWRGTSETDHFVQFYRTDDYLIECLAGYAADGIWNGDRVVIFATAAHRIALEERLRLKCVDVASATVNGQYLALDAAEMLAKFMVDGRAEPEAFHREVGDLVEHASKGGRRLRAFSEMVALLWAGAHRTAAIELEQLWNDLGRRHSFSLFCAYPAESANPSDGPALEHLCSAHSCVISITG